MTCMFWSLNSFFFSPLEQFDAIPVMIIRFFSLDLSFTNILIPILLSLSLIWLILNFFDNELKLIPEAWQFLFENIYSFVFDIIDQQIGYKGYIYLPFIFSIFFLVLLCNLISMTPFAFALTSHIIMTMLVSLSLCLAIFLIGLLTHNIEFLKIFIPECPFALLPLLITMKFFLILFGLLVWLFG